MIEKVPCAPIGVEYLASLPSFCAPIFEDDDPSQAKWVDFWALKPLGDVEIDHLIGEACAHEAIWYGRQNSQPEFVDLVITWMLFGLIEEGRRPGPLEQSFLNEVRRDDPAAFDRIAMRLVALYPHLRN